MLCGEAIPQVGAVSQKVRRVVDINMNDMTRTLRLCISDTGMLREDVNAIMSSMGEDIPTLCHLGSRCQNVSYRKLSTPKILYSVNPSSGSTYQDNFSSSCNREPLWSMPGTVTEFKFVSGMVSPVTPLLRATSTVNFCGDRPEPFRPLIVFDLAS
jgi:hypothetical protein